MKGFIKKRLRDLVGVIAKAFKHCGDIVIIAGVLGDVNNDFRVIDLKDSVLVSFYCFIIALALYLLDERLSTDE